MHSDIKYIVDGSGHRKEVIVPINLWKKLTKKSKSNSSNKLLTTKELRTFEDTITLTTNPVTFQRKIRDEWK